MDFGVDFGQKVDLTASIRNILRNYPEGTAILKELVQNADDAGARKITFCLDSRNHGTERLAGPALGQFQGPALMVYNDAMFTESDFKSIQRIGDSIKKTEETKSKIGRFGIGFNSVYHITELPSFVSSSYVVLLDPQAQFLPNVNPANPGKMVNFISDPSVLSRFSDQFDPYRGFGLDWTRPFEGTLFRFPLRTAAQGVASMLSNRAMTPDDVHELLMALKKEASAMLLFLKGVECIEIMTWEGQVGPELVFRAELTNTNDELRRQRQFVGTAIRQSNATAPRAGSSTTTNQTPVDFTLRIFCTAAGADMESVEEHWEVCNQLGGAAANVIAFDPANSFLRLVPWGGVAACVNVVKSANDVKHGLAYCFLPLPVRTGLPTMINGFFELSSNRRDVWQAGPDMTGDGKTRAAWNIALMSDVIGPSYCRLLLRLKGALGFSDRYQGFWPSTSVSHPWNIVSECALKACQTEKLLYKQTVFPIETDNKCLNDSARWIACEQAVLLPTMKATLLPADELSLAEVLITAKCPFVNCTLALREILISTSTCGGVADAAYVRTLLCEPSSPEPRFIPMKRLCGFLLQYCTSDISATQHASLSALNGLAIIPLSAPGDGENPALLGRSVGSMRVYTSQQLAAIDSLLSMGFPVSVVYSTLVQKGFNVDAAMEALMDTDIVVVNSKECSVLVICSDSAELELFRPAQGIIIDRNCLNMNEIEFLSDMIVQKSSNVKYFQPNLCIDILMRILPEECFKKPAPGGANNGVALDKLHGNGMGKDTLSSFIQQFWQYCRSRQEVVRAIAEGPCVVPTRTGSLFPVSRLSFVLSPGSIPVRVQDILEGVGVRILDTALVADATSMPTLFWDYIHPATRGGILQALNGALDGSSIAERFSSVSAEDRCELMAFLASCEVISSLSDIDIDILRSLPIYSSFHTDESDVKDTRKAFFALSTSHQTIGSKERLSEKLFPSYFVRHRDASELALLRALKVPVLSRSKYFREHLVANVPLSYPFDPELVTKDCLEMLVELPVLLDEDRSFLQFLKSTPFVPTNVPCRGSAEEASTPVEPTLCCPGDLYDPRDAELVSLLPDHAFPAADFHREDVLVYLTMLGLRGTLDWSGIVSCASAIADISSRESSDIENKRRRGESLLKFLDRNATTLLVPPAMEPPQRRSSSSGFSLKTMFFGSKSASDDAKETLPKFEDPSTYFSILNDLSWIPVMTIKSDFGMPWRQDTGSGVPGLAAPALSRPYRDAWMCSASLSLCQCSIHSAHLLKALGWSRPLHHMVIAKQLRQLSLSYTELSERNHENGGKEVIENDAVEAFQDLRERITALIPNLYQILNHVASSTLSQELIEFLGDVSWIWVGDSFVPVSRVAYVSPINFAPYLYLVPQDLSVYTNLLNAFGVRQSFSSRDYIRVLERMAAEAGSHLSSSDSDSTACEKPGPMGQPLTDDQLDLAVALVTQLNADTADSSGLELRGMSIYLPDQQRYLTMSSDLVIDDVPWLSGPEYISIRSGIQFLHNNIANKFATKIGIKSLRMLLVDRSVEQIFAVSDSTMEAFGQAESLTSRLKTILDMYPDGNPILSELIQNADDAGASVVRILVDENSYDSVSLLNPSMAPLQGPALLVGNDAQFAESDFRSLASIGQGSKLDKLTATGRFGLGFNSVYHLTDTPSVVSGESLVMFDPHTSYVPGATLAQPGLRLRFQGSSMKSTFPDQFSPYQFFGCNMNDSYPGTLFRFPLRTPTAARKSEISKRSYSLGDVDGMLNNLSSQLSNHLLFLRSVTTIELYRCHAGEPAPVLIKRAHASISDKETTNDQTLMTYFDKKSDRSGAVSKKISRDSFYDILSATKDENLPTSTYTVTVGVWDRQDRPLEEVKYVVASGLRGGSAKHSACDPDRRHLKLVPFGAVAACVSKRLNEYESEEISVGSAVEISPARADFPTLQGQAFCFLPLPVKTKLPVHVNAYFELSSNRRDIWKADDTVGDSRVRGMWNDSLLREVVAPLYAVLIEKVKAIYFSGIPRSEKNCTDKPLDPIRLLALLPCPVPQDNSWQIVAACLFPLIKHQKIMWSRGKQAFISVESSILIPSTTAENTSKEHEYKAITPAALSTSATDLSILELILVEESLPIVSVPLHIFHDLISSKCILDHVCPAVVRKHFQDRNDGTSHPAVDFHDIVDDDAARPPEPSLILQKKRNAAFLLSYCLSDLQTTLCAPESASAEEAARGLYGLMLVPTEGGRRHAVLQSATDPPLYLATDVERQLLLAATEKVIAGVDVLGSHLIQLFKTPTFSSHFNIVNLSPLDLLKLFREVLPSEWFWDSTIVVDRTPSVSDQWLRDLWSYIISSNSSGIFEGALPLLPVHVLNKDDGVCLLKLKAGVPLLHMMFRDNMPKPVMECLATMGLYVYNPEVLGGISFSPEVSRLLCESTTNGFIEALVQVIDKDMTCSLSEGWSENTKDCFRVYLLDVILSRNDELSPQQQDVICSLSIWRTSTELNCVALKRSEGGGFHATIPPALFMLPHYDTVADKLLRSKAFVLLRSEKDRELYKLLGLSEPSCGMFFAETVAPLVAGSVAACDTELLDKVATDILSRLPALEKEYTGFGNIFKTSNFVKNAAGGYSKPVDLYDPMVPHMTALLPEDAFPSSVLYGEDSITLVSLRALDMKLKLNCDGILRAAESIHLAASRSPESSDSAMTATAPAISRATELLKYLDNNVESLLSECDPSYLRIWVRGQHKDVAAEHTDSDDEVDTPVLSLGHKLQGGSWGEKLRSMQWIPVLTKPGADHIWDKNLPWPDTLHKCALAVGLNCALPKNRWLCSSTYRIISQDVKSSLLCNLMGWDRAVPGNSVAQQLLHFVDTFLCRLQNCTDSSDQAVTHEHYYTIIPRLYEALVASMMSEERRYVEIWLRALRNKPVVWIGSTFVEPTRVAFQKLSSVDTEPFLYTVKGELLSYSKLLKEVGVRETFDANDIAVIMRELFGTYKDMPLLEAKLDMCIGLINILIRLTHSKAATMRDANIPPLTPQATVESSSVDGDDAAAEHGVEDENQIDELSAVAPVNMEDVEVDEYWKQALGSLGAIYVPDLNGILAPAPVLCFDDASWAFNAVHERSMAGSRGKSQFRFVNKRLNNSTAKLLGVRSLREQLFSGDEVVCPSVSLIDQLLGNDSIVDAIGDLCGVADELAAEGVHFLLDCAEYPSESLIHPGLLEVQQMPALLVYYDGIHLESEILSRMFSSTEDVATLPYSCRIDGKSGLEHTNRRRSSSGKDSFESHHGGNDMRFPRCGKRLASAFTFTDCLQILSGEHLYVYDPCGKYIFTKVDSSKAANPTHERKRASDLQVQRAQRCKITGAEGDDFSSRFPDQLAPFRNLKFGMHSPVWNDGNLRGTVLRMPLRRSRSQLSPVVYTDNAVLQLLHSRIRPAIEGLLLFGDTVKRGSAHIVPRGDHREELLISMDLTSASASRMAMRQFVSDTSWKKGSGMLGFSLFKSYVPSEDDFRVGLLTRKRNLPDYTITGDVFGADVLATSDVAETQQDWLVLLSMGQSRLRDIVNRTPFAELNLTPFVSLAVRVVPAADTGIGDVTPGYMFSGGHSLGVSGLPFHVNAPFLQDICARGVPLSLAVDSSEHAAKPARSPASALSNRTGQRIISRHSRYEWNAAALSVIFESLFPKGFAEIVCLYANLHPVSGSRNLLSLYHQWPFLPRIQPFIAEIVRDVKLLSLLSTKPVFLCRGEFFPLDQLVLSYSNLPEPVVKYLQSFVNVSEIPCQIVKDMISCQVKMNSLSPAKLREILKPDRQKHCLQLNKQYHILLPLLRYALSDLERYSTHGDSVRRNTYRDIAGCPLLPMSNGCVRAFPAQSRDMVVFMTPALHCLLPSMRSLMIHPAALADIPLFQQEAFMDTLFIGRLSPQFLQDTLHHIIPPAWKRCQFVDCSDSVTSSILGSRFTADIEHTNYSAGSGIGLYSGHNLFGTGILDAVHAPGVAYTGPRDAVSGRRSGDTAPPSDLLIYLMWKDIIASSGPRLSMMAENIRDWPLLPVVVGPQRSKRLFASPSLLHLLPMGPHTDTEDAKRAGLVLEDLKLSAEVMGGAEKELQSQLLSVKDALGTGRENSSYPPDWDWASTDFQALQLNERLVGAVFREDTKMVASPQAGTNDELRPGHHDVPTHPPPSQALSGDLECTVLPVGHPLIEVFEKMYVPFFDGSIFEEPPSGTHVTGSVPPRSLGRNILNLLHCLHVQGSFVHECKLSKTRSEGRDVYDAVLADEPTRLLRFEALSVDDRRVILLEILNAHIGHALTENEVDMLKSLPLFTSRQNGVVSIAQCSAVYWCSSAAVLQGLSIPTDGDNDSALSGGAVILHVDESLRQLYELLGAEQLTPAVAVRRFTLPALNQMVGGKRVEIMRGVAEHWTAYRDDVELVQLLKTVAFVPSWHFQTFPCTEMDVSADRPTGIEVEDYDVPLRCPNQLFSWTNGALLEALQGDALPNYFPPRAFREASWHALLLDLGMETDIGKDGMLRLAGDIQDSIDDSSDISKKLSSIRGRHLLHYALEGNRLFFDTDLARRLGKIRFVPVEWPSGVESGGLVHYSPEVCRFDQTVASHCGHLAFTLLPVLSSEFSPPQNFYSALGINASPSVDVVLRHFRNLTVLAGDALDRRNTQQFPLIPTFSAIFTYIFDKWRDIPIATKDALRVTNIIPIGHYLVRPSRVFFRLSEDLSPFMHELPRAFGIHELFLKEVGVREQPSPDDYIKFLTELATESGGACLNPNELKAVITIIQAIVAQVELDGSISTATQVYVPDEAGILRPSPHQLHNDSGWLRSRLDVSFIQNNYGVYILHPLISDTTARRLGINSLSKVFIEQLASGFSPVGIDSELDCMRPYQQLMASREFASALLLLEPKCVSAVSGAEPGLKLSEILSIVSTVDIRFVRDLRVRIVLCPKASGSLIVNGAGVVVHDDLPSLCFVDASHTVYVSSGVVSTSDSIINLATGISLGLCTILSLEPAACNLISTLIISGISRGLSSIGQVLTDLRIGRDEVSDRELSRGIPGVSVVSVDQCMLELKPFRSFRIGEVVACQQPSAVPSPADELGAPSSINYVYAIVVEVGEPGDGGLRKLLLKLGDGGNSLVSYLSTDVYSFRPAREGVSMPRAADQRGGGHSLNFLSGQESNKPIFPDSSKRAGGSAGLEVGIDSSDVMTALQGLLSRAGVPISLDEEALVAKIVALQSAKQLLESELKDERSSGEETRLALSRSADNMRCQICVSNPVTLVLVPCGHTICAECADQIPRNKCPFCRAVMREKVKFFVGDEDS